MAEDEDRGDNRPDDMILDEKVVKMGGELAAIFAKRKNLNTEAANIYANAEKLGIPSAALQVAVKMVRVMDKDDRKAYQYGVRRALKALEPAAADLFAEDVERVSKRKAKAAEKAARDAAKAGKETPEQQERRIAADSNPRSKPKASSAKKPKDAVEKLNRAPLASETPPAADPATAEAEQAEGAAIRDAVGKPKSQTQIAAEKRAEAKVP